MAEGVPARADGRWFAPLAAIAVGVVLLAIAAIAVVVVPIGSATGPANGPEQSFEAFGQAVGTHNWPLADQYLSIGLIKTGVLTEDSLARVDEFSVDSITVVERTQMSARLLIVVDYRIDGRSGRARACSSTWSRRGTRGRCPPRSGTTSTACRRGERWHRSGGSTSTSSRRSPWDCCSRAA